MALGSLLFEENFDNKQRWEIALDSDEAKTQHFAVGTGRFKGANFKDNHNVIVSYLPDGKIHYEEKGYHLRRQRGEIATLNGHGLARPNKKGGCSGGGSYIFKVKSTNGGSEKKGRKFASLDNVIGVYELESDKESNGTQKWWEWKNIVGGPGRRGRKEGSTRFLESRSVGYPGEPIGS
jgi:hypothetical protein